MNQNKNIQKITNAAMFAAVLASASLINRYLTGHGGAIAKMLGATKETQFYIIPALTLYMVGKFGLKEGFKFSLAGTLVGLLGAFILGTTGGKANIVSFLANYVMPWTLCTLIAFVAGKDWYKTALASILIWLGVLVSWSVAGVMFWNLTFKASMLWGIVTYQGWAMFIIMPIFNIFINYRINKLKK